MQRAGDGVDVALAGANTPKSVGSGPVGRYVSSCMGTPRRERSSYCDRAGDASGRALGVAGRAGGVERALPQDVVQEGDESEQAVVDALLVLEKS
ncbi:hypothetical protein [Streptomyces griseoluteus]|uniref:hypothetical protein n=1 Tax=Streptomyces griseoluteus TaxID=29306 RepID=UPI0036B2204C